MIHLLEGTCYREAARSRALPILSAEMITSLVASSRKSTRPDWKRQVRASPRP